MHITHRIISTVLIIALSSCQVVKLIDTTRNTRFLLRNQDLVETIVVSVKRIQWVGGIWSVLTQEQLLKVEIKPYALLFQVSSLLIHVFGWFHFTCVVRFSLSWFALLLKSAAIRLLIRETFLYWFLCWRHLLTGRNMYAGSESLLIKCILFCEVCVITRNLLDVLLLISPLS